MTRFTRKGHWRTLADGTRTFISAHAVERDPKSLYKFDAAVLERRLHEKSEAGQKNASETRKVWQPIRTEKPTKKAMKAYRKRLRERAEKDRKRKK